MKVHPHLAFGDRFPDRNSFHKPEERKSIAVRVSAFALPRVTQEGYIDFLRQVVAKCDSPESPVWLSYSNGKISV